MPRRSRLLLLGLTVALLGAAAWFWLSPSNETGSAPAASPAAEELDERAASRGEPGAAVAAPTADAGVWIVLVVDDATGTPISGAEVDGYTVPAHLPPACPCAPPPDASSTDGDDEPSDEVPDPFDGTLLDDSCDCETATLALLDYHPGPTAPVVRLHTDSTGHAELPSDAGLAFVAASAPGHASSTDDLGDERPTTVRLPSARSLRLAFVDEQGQPVTEVRAALLSSEPLGEIPLRADGDRLVAAAAPASPLELVAAAAGFRPLRADVLSDTWTGAAPLGFQVTISTVNVMRSADTRADGTFEVMLYTPRTLRGRAVAGARGVPGAVVHADDASVPDVRSDARGRFTFEDLPAAEELTLVAHAPGLLGAVKVGHLNQDTEADVEIPMTAPAEATVTVLDGPSGAKLGEATARLRPGDDLEDIASDAKGVASEPGVFHFGELFPGDYTLSASEDGHAPAERTVHLAAGEARRFELRLTPGLTLSGQVVDDHGKPVADADVEANPPRDVDPSLPLESAAVTDARGRFALHGLPAGRVVVSAQHDDFLSDEAPAEAGGADVTVVIHHLASLDGHVIGARGPAARVSLRLLPADGGGRAFDSTNSDDEGHFAFQRCAEGPALVAAQASAFGIATELPVALQAGQNHLDLHLDPGGTISGVVLDGDGNPAGGARVVASPVSLGARMLVARQGTSRTAASEADGTFTLVALDESPGDYFVGATTETAATAPNVKAHVGDSGVELRMRTRPRIRGRLLGSAGAPITAFQVDHKDVSAADGRFEQWGSPSMATVTFTGPFIAKAVPLGDLDGGVADVGDVTVEDGLTVSGRVVDATGRVVRDCRVSSRTDWSLEPPGLDPFHDAQADATGHFTFTHLPPGHYLLTAICEGGTHVFNVPVTVVAGMGPVTLSAAAMPP